MNGQSAIEYLMTYGWMLLVVAIVGGAVFSVVGDQGIESVQGFGGSDVVIDDFGVSQEDGLMFSMSDPVGQTEVQEIKVSNPDTANITYVLDQSISGEKLVNLPGIKPSSGTNEVEVQIIYNTGSLENLSTSGTITGDLKIDELFRNKTMIMDGLVSYWPLNEKYSSGNTVYDLSSNNNHATKVNNPQYLDRVIGGQSLLLEDEGDGVNGGDIFDFRQNDSFSYSIWVLFKNNSYVNSDTAPDNAGIMSRGSGSGGYGTRVTHTEDGGVSRIQFIVRGDSSIRATWSDPDVDTWYHLAGTYDGNTGDLTLYVDGEEKATSTGSAEFSQDQEFQPINGGHISGSGVDFKGEVDNAIMYNRVLSPQEIQTIYSRGGVE